MVKRIIVAYDGSELGREAFAYGLVLAQRTGAPVVGFRAIEPAAAAGVVPDPAIGVGDVLIDPRVIEEALEAERARAAREMPELAGFARQAGVAYSVQVVEGSLVEGLREFADPTDLVCVGLKGRFAANRIGSSALALVNKGPCPVLFASGPMRDIGRVLCAFDGSGASRRAVEWSRDLAPRANWPLTVLAVAGKDMTLEEALAEGQRLAPEAMVVHYGPEGKGEAAQVEEAARHASAALVVMGSTPDSWLRRLFFGSAALHVLATVKAPVVLMD